MWVTTEDGKLVNMNNAALVNVVKSLSEGKYNLRVAFAGEDGASVLFTGTDEECRERLKRLERLLDSVSLA